MRLQFSSTFGNGHGLSAEIMGSSPSSVILVANKIDQVEDRMVSTEEGNKSFRLQDYFCKSEYILSSFGFF